LGLPTENGQVVPLPWGIRPTPPANVSRQDAQTHLVPKTTLLKLVTPKWFGITHFDPEVGSVDRQQAVVSDVSHLPVIKLNLNKQLKDMSVLTKGQKSNNQTKNAHHCFVQLKK
jgi:hypothetical protein